jgi:hypothetical protein
MSARLKKVYPALKHGGYSVTGLLPGEDRVAFERLHRELRAELCPDGPLEEDTVFDIARRIWRKQNLESFRLAEAARERLSAIRSQMKPSTPRQLGEDWLRFKIRITPENAVTEAEEAQARKELGEENYKFIEMGAAATIGQLITDLDVEQRLNAEIAKLFRTLCMLKAFKSVSSTKSPSSIELPRISGPKKAA